MRSNYRSSVEAGNPTSTNRCRSGSKEISVSTTSNTTVCGPMDHE